MAGMHGTLQCVCIVGVVGLDSLCEGCGDVLH